MKRTYEMMLLLKPDMAGKDEKAIRESIGAFLGKDTAIKELTVLGKKHLAFPIQKFTDGVYVLVKAESSTLKISALEQSMKMGSDVIRYLVTKEG